FVVGVGANPANIVNNEDDLNRFIYKVSGGAEFALTQPVFDAEIFERFVTGIQNFKIPIIAGILPLPNFKTAEFMHYEVPGCAVPERILDRMRQAESLSPEHARAEGIDIAREIVRAVRGMAQGIQIRGPFDRYETALEVLSS